MPAGGQHDVEGPAGRGPQHPEDGRAVARVAVLVLALEDGVEGGQRRARVGVVDGGGAQRVAGQRGEGGGVGALAADVAQEERPAAVVQREQVVEVAAHLVQRGGVVGGGRVEAGHGGQHGRQQGALEGAGQPFGVGAHPPLHGERVGRGPAALQFVHHQRGQLAERGQLVGGRGARPAVQHADRAQAPPVGGGDRRGGVEAHPGAAGDQRVPGAARVGEGVLHHVRLGLLYGRRAQSGQPLDLADAVQAVHGLEPDPIGVHHGHRRHGGVEEPGRQRGDPVEGAVRGGVQDAVAVHRGQPAVLVGGRTRGRVRRPVHRVLPAAVPGAGPGPPARAGRRRCVGRGAFPAEVRAEGVRRVARAGREAGGPPGACVRKAGRSAHAPAAVR